MDDSDEFPVWICAWFHSPLRATFGLPSRFQQHAPASARFVFLETLCEAQEFAHLGSERSDEPVLI